MIKTDPCIWIYRDCHCDYRGDLPTCDKTYDSCIEHGNQVNFGGFPPMKGVEL